MNTLKRIINVKNWKKKTKITVCVAILLVIVAVVLSAIKPSEADMISQASPQMQEMIKKDETLTRKRVSAVYNSLGIINYSAFTTSGATELSEKFIGFAGQIYKADNGFAGFVGKMVNYTYRMLGCGENMLHGAKLTISLTTFTVILGVILGVFLALGKISKNKIINKLASAYVFFFRGTPLLIQLFVVYFTAPGIFGFAWRDFFSASDADGVYKGAFIAALIAFALNSGAYCAEIVRAAIQSIDKGQYEAAKALGMNYSQTMSLVIIPQSIRRMLPAISNEFIMVLKDASLVFAISLMDITTISNSIMNSDGSYIVFIPALIIYLIITAFFTYIFNKIEKKFSIYE